MVQASPHLYAQGPRGIRVPQFLQANNKFTTFAPLPGYPLGLKRVIWKATACSYCTCAATVLFLVLILFRAQVIASSIKSVFLFTDCGGFAQTLRPKLTK